MRMLLAAGLIAFSVTPPTRGAEEAFVVHPRQRVETEADSGRFHAVTRTETWDPARTAVIVVDMWDSHHSQNAVLRVGELAPRMNAFLKAARTAGATIVHAPSGCMEAYADHPARKHVATIPRAANLPPEIGKWCYVIPSEEQGEYPLDQTRGGEDDDSLAHAKWVASLLDAGLNPKAPWTRQIDTLDVEPLDFVTDSGEEVWSLLEHGRIDNVMILGVHTNMCILGRPFGLRRMAENGKHVVLVRDLTDTMYNPNRHPYVSHFTGTDLIVEHVEKYVCPTILSSDVLADGTEFRFEQDDRKHLVLLIGEDEYETEKTLPAFAKKYLGHDFRVTEVHANPKDRDDFPGIDAVADADVLFVSARRRVLPAEQMKFVRDHVNAGKPVVGVRTASHAFTLRNAKPPEGYVDWPEFDHEVLGGNYTNHHGNGPKVTVALAEDRASARTADHPVLRGVDPAGIVGHGSLYRTGPLSVTATPLLIGTIPGQEPEPVAWVNAPKAGNRVFYTALAQKNDFGQPAFDKLLLNGIYWAAGLEVPEKLPAEPLEKRLKTAKVTGHVTLNGQPVAGAVVEFAPREGEHRAAGWTNAEGKFALRTLSREDGALLGPHEVRITRTHRGEELIPGRYNEQSSLTADVRVGENELNFELTTK
jgi:nicotinamidase-related amidase/type 1 glutamine amidotransferase